MLSFIKKMTSLIVTNFSQKLSDLKNFNFEVILRYYNLDLDNNLYFQNFHRKTKISTLESLISTRRAARNMSYQEFTHREGEVIYSELIQYMLISLVQLNRF